MLTQKQVWEKFSYDGEEGVLRHRHTHWGRKREGKVLKALTDKGYVVVYINGKNYFAHRIIWLWVYGEFPEAGIDHVNRNRADNRLDNLREATQKQNLANRSKSRCNTSGYVGVARKKDTRGWVATCKFEGKNKHLGVFDTAEEASEAYQAFASQLRGAFHPT